MAGISNSNILLGIDDFLVYHDLLFVAPPASMAGKVMLVENWGNFNWARFSDPQIIQLIWWGSTSNYNYTWNADAGLACALLGLEKAEQLECHYLRGALFENAIFVEKMKGIFNAGRFPHLFFWRDHRGRIRI